jgi:TrmH family RNA methyltransferase
VESRRSRREEHRYVIVGPRLLAEALDASVAVDTLYCDAGDPGRHRQLLERFARAGVPPTWVGAGVLDRVGDTRTSQGITAVVPAPHLQADEVPDRGAPLLVVVLVDVADPGNLGTLLRTADAAGADAVVLAGDVADPLSPKVVRAAAGALFRLRLVESVDPLALLRRWQVPALGLVVGDGLAIDRADLTGPVALFLGGEARGLPAEICQGLAGRLTIPMPGRAESLNVAMAGTVAVFEALRQRRAARTGASAGTEASASQGGSAAMDLAVPGAVGQGSRP